MAYKVVCDEGIPAGEFGYTVFPTRKHAEMAIARVIEKDVREGARCNVFFNIADAYDVYKIVEV